MKERVRRSLMLIRPNRLLQTNEEEAVVEAEMV